MLSLAKVENKTFGIVMVMVIVSPFPITLSESLREYPTENHAVLKYESTSTLSDLVQILCRVTGNAVGRILSQHFLTPKRYRG